MFSAAPLCFRAGRNCSLTTIGESNQAAVCPSDAPSTAVRARSKRMRILYLINSVEGGGAELPVPRIARALSHHGANMRVFALTRRDGRALDAFKKAGLPCTVREGGRKDHAAAYRWVGEILRQERPDVLWTSLSRATILGQRAAARLRIPVVSWQHAAYLKPGSAFLLRYQQRMTSLWIADSERVSELTARRLRVEPNRLLTWPIFAADSCATWATPWDGHEPLRIGSLGRLHPIKGYDVLAEAISLLDRGGFRAPVEWVVTVAGDGPERERLLKIIDGASHARIHLAGYVSEPTSFLAGLHAYVQPSRSEGFCIAAHEAMQAGLPVLASAVGGLTHSVRVGRTGWLVAPGDASRLADGLAAMLSDPSRLALMGSAGRAFVFDEFGEERFNAMAGTIVARIAALVQEHRPASGPATFRSA